MADALHTPGVTSAAEARIDDAGLLAVQSTGALTARTGVLAGPGTLNLVTGTTDTAPMAVLVGAHHWVTSRATADGVYRGAMEVATRVSIAAAPASGTRTDVVYVKQNDASSTITPDATTAPVYAAVTGTVGGGKPAIPVGAEELATVSVTAGATNTLGTGITITNTARQTTARGGILPERTQAALGNGSHPGATGYDVATKRFLYWSSTEWVKFGGAREQVFASDNVSPSTVPVSPGGAATVKTGTFTSPCAADTGLIRVDMGVQVSSSTIYVVKLLVNGITIDSQLIDTAGDRPPIALVTGVSLINGSNSYSLELYNTAGGTANATWAGIRVTI